jgi:hypothetical protein
MADASKGVTVQRIRVGEQLLLLSESSILVMRFTHVSTVVVSMRALFNGRLEKPEAAHASPGKH